MKWFEVIVTTTEEACDAVTEMLTTIGAGGVAIEDPNEIRREISRPDSLDYADDEFLNSLGTDVTVKAYFNGSLNITELSSLIKEKLSFIANFLDVGKGYSGFSEIDDEDWATSWKKYYKPFKISNKVVIKPSWEEYEKAPDDIVITLDPGMAFGTGTHETTRMCSQLIEKYIKPENTVIDVGCGTGILSIIAVKLGAKRATLIDVDETAVKVSLENAELNGVQDAVKVFKSDLRGVVPEKYDVVVANIIADVIVGISKAVPDYLKNEGYLITSGIIKERLSDVLAAYEGCGFSRVETLEMGEWVAVVFKCQSSL